MLPAHGRRQQTTSPKRRYSVVSLLLFTACFITAASVYIYSSHNQTHKDAVLPAYEKSISQDEKKGGRNGQKSTIMDYHSRNQQAPIPFQLPTEVAVAFNEDYVLSHIVALKDRVRKLRSSKKVLMPVDPAAIALTASLQNATRCYLMHTLFKSDSVYQPLNLAIELKFPHHMTSSDAWLNRTSGGSGVVTLYVELSPALLLPHAVFTISQIAKTFKSGHFHRNAGHVLQSNVQAKYTGGVVFMEYDRSFPHEKYTLGFAGRGGGNAFYISTQNNTMAHGPGTDRGGKDPESDTDFGIVVPGYNGVKIVESMTRQSGPKSKNGFIEGKKNFIDILSLRLLNISDMRKEIGLPTSIQRTKYSERQDYLKGLQNMKEYASAEEYCLPYLKNSADGRTDVR